MSYRPTKGTKEITFWTLFLIRLNKIAKTRVMQELIVWYMNSQDNNKILRV